LVWLSIKAAFISRAIVVLLGTVISKWMARQRFEGKIVIETLLMLPPSVIGFFNRSVWKNSWIGKTIEMLFHVPIMFTWLIMRDKL
jgi:molybdate transport system permease protein